MITSSEHNEQVGFVTWFYLKFPEILLFAIPNGEYRNISVAKKLKQEGVVPGVPDLFIPEWKLWIEMKQMKGGVVSKEQERIHTYLRGIGHTVIIGYGAEDASRKVLGMIKK